MLFAIAVTIDGSTAVPKACVHLRVPIALAKPFEVAPHETLSWGNITKKIADIET